MCLQMPMCTPLISDSQREAKLKQAESTALYVLSILEDHMQAYGYGITWDRTTTWTYSIAVLTGTGRMVLACLSSTPDFVSTVSITGSGIKK